MADYSKDPFEFRIELTRDGDAIRMAVFDLRDGGGEPIADAGDVGNAADRIVAALLDADTPRRERTLPAGGRCEFDVAVPMIDGEPHVSSQWDDLRQRSYFLRDGDTAEFPPMAFREGDRFDWGGVDMTDVLRFVQTGRYDPDA